MTTAPDIDRSAPAIEVKGLTKSFVSRQKGEDGKPRPVTVEAVRGLDLTVRHGQVFGFLGPNGAGKTTTLRILTTLLLADAGQATVAGFDVRSQPRQVRRHVGYVGQLGGADRDVATGRENVYLAARLYGLARQQAEERTARLLDDLDLTDLADRYVSTYSGGQRRRLEIALGLVGSPQVLFLDEPTTGLDPQNRANLWDAVRALRDRGTTVFLTTHYLDEADALADEVMIVDHGQAVASGPPDELKQQLGVPTLDDVFLTLTGRSLRDTNQESFS